MPSLTNWSFGDLNAVTLVKSDANCFIMSQQLQKFSKLKPFVKPTKPTLLNENYQTKSTKQSKVELWIIHWVETLTKEHNSRVCCGFGNVLLVRPIAVRLERKKCLLSWSLAEPFLTWIFWSDEEN